MDHAAPWFSERSFRSQPDGSLWKFPRRLGQFPLSIPADSRWGPALSAMEPHGPRISRLVDWVGLDWREESGELGEDGRTATVKT
mgnify:CR=1 FL=1|jgi:hypothetical protein